MAVYHFNVAILSQSDGPNGAVGAAAYRHNAKMKNHLYGKYYNYTDKGDLIHSEITVPDDAPNWARKEFGDKALEHEINDGSLSKDGNGINPAEQEFGFQFKTRFPNDEILKRAIAANSERLWNGVELYETRNNKHRNRAQYARKFTFSLPVELPREDQISLAKTFVTDSFAARGMVADWVIHDPINKKNQTLTQNSKPGLDQNPGTAPSANSQTGLDQNPGSDSSPELNPHVHVMVTTRVLGEKDWGLKNRSWNAKDLLFTWRFEWAAAANLVLARAGLADRIDHRCYVDQGIMLEPQNFNPYVALHAEAAGDLAREKARNEEMRGYNEVYMRTNPEHILTVLGARKTMFTLSEIRVALMERISSEHAGVEDLDRLMKRVVSSIDLVQLEARTPGGHVLYSTKARMTLENNLVVGAIDLAESRLDVDVKAGLAELPDDLRDSQRAAAEAMLGAERLTMVTGYAGSGKTHTLREVAKIWRSRKFEVIGGAASGKATQELSGIESMEAASLAAWEARWSRGRVPAKNFVFIMDEAGMVGSDVWARIQSQVADMGGKFIVVGDPEQLQPVEETSAFLMVQERIGASVMDEIVRQIKPGEREASRNFALGKDHARKAIRHYANAGNVRFENDAKTAIGKISEAYFATTDTPPGEAKNEIWNEAGGKAGDKTWVEPRVTTIPQNRIALALSNKDVWALNEALRTKAISLGVVDGDGEREFGQIVRVARQADGRDMRVSIPLRVANGDRLIFTKSHRALDIPKSSLGTVIEVRDCELIMQVDGINMPVIIDMSAFTHFDYGFAVTVHKSQGMTVDHAHVLGHGYMNQHLAYVAMSRHRKSVDLYVPKDRIEDMGMLERVVQRKGYLSFPVEQQPEYKSERYGPGIEGVDASDRLDRTGSKTPPKVVGFEGDAHLAGVAGRISGLLASEYVAGDPIFAGDTRGYEDNPISAVDDLAARQSTFRAADVADRLAAVVKEPETFMRLFGEAMIAHPDLIVLEDETAQGGSRMYSTKGQVALELSVIDRGTRLALMAKRDHPEPGHYVQSKVTKKFGLDDAQEDALRIAAKGRLHVISGASGTGKTRLAAAIADVHHQQGWQVIGMAPTGVGADNLREAGDGSSSVMTVAGLEHALENGRITLNRATILVLDEAGLMGAKSADRLLELVEKSGAKFVALRDNDQIGAMEAGAVFRALETRIGGIELGVSHRSQNVAVGGAVEQISKRDVLPEEVVRGLQDAGVLQAGGSRVRAIGKLAVDFVADRSLEKVAMAHSRADVAALNSAIRTGLDEQMPERLAHLAKDGPEVAAARPGSIADLRTGDRIVLTSNFREARLRAGTALVVEQRKSRGRVVLRTVGGDEKLHLKFRGEQEGFEYGFGFATTVHRSKGRTVDSVHMLATPGMSRNLFHTGASIHRSSLNVVLPTTGERIATAMRAILQTDDTARSVLDYGFEAAKHAQEALKDHVPLASYEPNKLLDGVDRIVDWVANIIDVGTDQAAAPKPATPALHLRAAVISELMAAHSDLGRTGKDTFSADEREQLGDHIDKLINQQAWQKLRDSLIPGGRKNVPAGDRVEFPAEFAQHRNVDRVLQRGIVLAKGADDDQITSLFQRARTLMEARVKHVVLQNELIEERKAADIGKEVSPDAAGLDDKSSLERYKERMITERNARLARGDKLTPRPKTIAEEVIEKAAQKRRESEARGEHMPKTLAQEISEKAAQKRRESEARGEHMPKTLAQEISEKAAQKRRESEARGEHMPKTLAQEISEKAAQKRRESEARGEQQSPRSKTVMERVDEMAERDRQESEALGEQQSPRPKTIMDEIDEMAERSRREIEERGDQLPPKPKTIMDEIDEMAERSRREIEARGEQLPPKPKTIVDEIDEMYERDRREREARGEQLPPRIKTIAEEISERAAQEKGREPDDKVPDKSKQVDRSDNGFGY